MKLKVTTLFLSITIFSSFSKAADTGELLLGGMGSVLIHEAGHALAVKSLGGEVMAFKPYPLKVKFEQPDGSYKDKWVAGLVKHSKFEGENSDTNNAIVSAMGSGTNMLSVLILAPLLPSIKSDFGKNSFDSMLFISTFDAPAYALVDMIKKDENNDWAKVSKLTGIPLYWYFLGTLTASLVVNEYRFHYHKKAFERDVSNNRFAVGFKSEF